MPGSGHVFGFLHSEVTLCLPFHAAPRLRGLTSRLTCPLADEPCGREVRLPRRVTAQGQASSPPLRASPRTIRLWSIFPCGQSESPRCPGCWPLILKRGCRAWWLHSPRVTRRHSSPYVSETKPSFPEKGLSSLRPHMLTPADPPHRPRPRRSPRPPSQPALRSDPTRPDVPPRLRGAGVEHSCDGTAGRPPTDAGGSCEEDLSTT